MESDDEDYIRDPDQIFTDRLIDIDDDNYQGNNEDYIDPYDIDKAIEISMNEFELNQVKEHMINERIRKENLEKEKDKRRNILKQFNTRLNYFKSDSNIFVKQLSIYLNNELEDYMECKKDYIYLFKKHYEVLNELLDNLYKIPLSKNIKPRIEEESYNLLKNICKYL